MCRDIIFELQQNLPSPDNRRFHSQQSVATAKTMTIRLYGYAESTYSGPIEGLLSPGTSTGRVLATLFEKNVKNFEVVKVDFLRGESKKPEYLALQPFGTIPAMVDGPLTLFESRAMARYIADKWEGSGTALYGDGADARATVEQWMEVEGQSYNPPLAALVWEVLFKVWAGGAPDGTAVEAAAQRLSGVLDVYEAHLARSRYLAGDFFSLADLSHIPYTYFLANVVDRQHRDLLWSRPHVAAWWQAISSRPSWQKVLDVATGKCAPAS